MFACKLLSVRDICPAVVVKAADASTAPLVILPVGVTKVTVAALTGDTVIRESDIAAAPTALVNNERFLGIFFGSECCAPLRSNTSNRPSIASFQLYEKKQAATVPYTTLEPRKFLGGENYERR